MSRLKLTRQEMAIAVGPEHNAIVQFQNLFDNLGGLEEAHIWIGDTNNDPQPQTVSGDIALDLTGIATLQESANVVNVVNSIVSDSGIGILSTDIFGRRAAQPSVAAQVISGLDSAQNVLINRVFGG